MAKNDKARVRVFFGEIEGDNETVQDALRSIGAAVNRTFQPNTLVVKTLAVGDGVGEKQLAEKAAKLVEEDDQQAELELDTETAEKPSKSGSQKPRKFATYSHIKDLNLRPVGKQSLREFYAQKKPSDQQQQLTVVVYYLCRILEIPHVTPNHVFTGIKDIEGFRVPNDIAAVIRNISVRKGWIDSSDSQSYKMTTPGDNFVGLDLPSSKPAGDESE